MQKLSLEEIRLLSAPERLTLISDLWDSLGESEIPLTAAQRHELDHRLEALETEQQDCIPWEVLEAEFATHKF